VALQQQLLRDLSHELRTPLSRLRVASESEQDLQQLRERIGREVDGMQRLVEDTLQLAWLDTERTLPDEAIQVQALWEMLTENACYESGWPSAVAMCGAVVLGARHLNTLAQALEKTCCVTPFDIRPLAASCAISDGGRVAITGICGWKIRAAACRGRSGADLRRSPPRRPGTVEWLWVGWAMRCSVRARIGRENSGAGWAPNLRWVMTVWGCAIEQALQ
jgi:hypothetical protein